MISRFFIDRPDLRHGAVRRHRPRRRRGLLPAARRAVPGGRAAHRPGDGHLPGANAKTVADTVATPIEQEVNGVERMLYMSSQCTNDGQMTLDVTFELGTDLDTAQVLVQNRVAVAEAKLPEEVKRTGVTTKKKSPSILMCVNLVSLKRPDGGLLLRPGLPQQLCDAQRQGRPLPHQGRRRRDLPGAARLQHAHLARPGQAGRQADDGRRRDQLHQGAEPPGRRRPARPAPRAVGRRPFSSNCPSRRANGSPRNSSSRTSSSAPAPRAASFTSRTWSSTT